MALLGHRDNGGLCSLAQAPRADSPLSAQGLGKLVLTFSLQFYKFLTLALVPGYSSMLTERI